MATSQLWLREKTKLNNAGFVNQKGIKNAIRIHNNERRRRSRDYACHELEETIQELIGEVS
tara:strand:+ start:172 stop:354 length:183 start_codon:yes stop_codon:yes gene_type:complete